VIAAVVLDDQPRRGVIQVRSADSIPLALAGRFAAKIPSRWTVGSRGQRNTS
jgi:hypothetical protein